MRVGIVGAGAIGLLTAAYLHDKYDVTVYTRRHMQANVLNEQGLSLVKQGQQRTISIRAKLLDDELLTDDVVIVAVKQYDVAYVIERCKQLSGVETFIFLQNGMGHVRLLSHLKTRNIVLGVVEHGALKHDDRTVEHTGMGKTILSLFQGELGKAEQLLMTPIPDFPFHYADDWEEMLTKKLVVNAVINPLTALLRVKNGKLLEVNEYQTMMELLFSEIKTVLALPNEQEAWEHIVSICRKTAGNRSSMLTDIEQGRKTEIDGILGYVIGKGQERGIPTPLSQFLFYAIKGLEGRKGNG
ncbi:2-dehydropantoate 2-reductase [Thermaerobacillus caldiproteolyticus]|uniref:2-dehydropantoate 2-reductase n=1 Tax=Thermaerobacillus caldiproteolyticus TaxID=247480 RepID=A0A7V9Z4X4_9BACL|nr:2-dehydropantoate 2-reductase [Anoxybacillus caldiproteolyticus]MBA2874094.1 2-dehydropantoate 2-reductase [Anoxybacillus caldiproteolyticus]